MTANQDIRDIFSILHDGRITAWSGDKYSLTLTVDCEYLAERIDKSFDKFFVELTELDELFLLTWPNPFDLPVQTLSELNDIFKAELEILSADIKDGKVIIACNQHDTDFDYCGGNLIISCKTIKVFDQNRSELTIEEFDTICKSYWNDINRQQEKLINDRKK
ncbi:hypothetical protein [Flavobacterium sp. UBA6135]|uniref:hypothetical protein n=1 Tax=Flavobacterium sp. UBA6135 TaxID=1946553 RepID=UPI0025BB6C3F|nr:hypothetical protein [Flavobacterium sp. UBA6135]